MKPLLFFLSISLFLLLFGLSSPAQQNTGNDAVLIEMYQNQRYAEAVDYLKKNYPEPVTDLKILSRYAYANRMAGKLPEAEAYYLRIYEKDSTTVPVLLNLAGIQIKRENDTKALFYYEKAIRIDTANFSVFKQLGRLYLEKPDTSNALKYLQKANFIQPEEADVAADLSLLMISMKKSKEAELVLNRALKADSTNLLLLRSLAKLYYFNDKFKEAVKTCEKLKISGDGSGEVLNMLATSYFKIKIYDCAIENFSDLQMQSERTLYLTAMSFKALEKYRMAAEYFDKTLKEAISPYSNIYYDEKGAVCEKAKEFNSAAEAYEKELFFKEKDIIYYTLASLYDRDLNDKKSAVMYYRKYLQAKPPLKQQVYINYVQVRLNELSK